MPGNPAVLKLSVLSSGELLLNGSGITLGELEPLLAAAAARNDLVWYYRESASADGPSEALQVLQLVVKHKLRLSLSSKPDFSDWVDAQGRSHPRIASDQQDPFSAVRQAAARGQLVIVRPAGNFLLLPKLPAGSVSSEMTAGPASLVPPDCCRNIAVIATVESEISSNPTVTDIQRTIPFFGLLMAFSYLGHAVWVFDGKADSLAAGCRGADVLLIDSQVLPSMQSGWLTTTAAVMRNHNVLIHDRATSNLRMVPTAGNDKGRLTFR